MSLARRICTDTSRVPVGTRVLYSLANFLLKPSSFLPFVAHVALCIASTRDQSSTSTGKLCAIASSKESISAFVSPPPRVVYVDPARRGRVILLCSAPSEGESV
eukprot:IDg12197t1